MNLLLTLPFGSKTEEDEANEANEETDGLKLKATPRNVATIESSKLMSAAIDFVKDRVIKVEDNGTKESEEVSDSEKQIIAYKNIIFDFKLKEIKVLLFQGLDRHQNSAIASAQLKSFEAYGELLTDSSLWVTCLIADLCLNDVRTSRGNEGITTLFEKKYILVIIIHYFSLNCLHRQLTPSTSTPEQKDSFFSIVFTQKSNERFIEITISGFRLILALDYLLNLSNIITKAFEIESDSNASKTSAKSSDKPKLEEVSKAVERAKQLSSAVEKTEVTNVLHFNLSQIDIVLLDSIEDINASAIIMTCYSSINVKQKPNFIQLYGEVSEISWILTNYKRYISAHEIDAYIMKPTTLTINGNLHGENILTSLSNLKYFVFQVTIRCLTSL